MEFSGKKVSVIVLTLVMLVVFILFMIRCRYIIISVLTPFVMGIVIAYLINPAVISLEQRGINRVKAVVLIYVLLVFAVISIAYLLLPLIYREASKLVDALPFYVFKAKNSIDRVYAGFSKNLTPQIKGAIEENIDTIQGVVAKHVKNAGKIFFSVFESIINWVLAVVISFYLVKDKDYFCATVNYLVPVCYRTEIYRVYREIDRVLTRFIRGQLVVALIVGTLSGIGFLIIDLNFALLMGVFTGAANIIPYFGPIIGGIPVTIIGLMDSYNKALQAVVVVFAVQQLESGVITPKIIGESVGIHPVYIILSLFAGGRVFGVIGMLFAVPVTAVLNIIIKYIFNKIMHPI